MSLETVYYYNKKKRQVYFDLNADRVISNDIHKSNVNTNLKEDKKQIDENRREMAFSFKINNAPKQIQLTQNAT